MEIGNVYVELWYTKMCYGCVDIKMCYRCVDIKTNQWWIFDDICWCGLLVFMHSWPSLSNDVVFYDGVDKISNIHLMSLIFDDGDW